MVAINRNSGYGEVLRIIKAYRPHAMQNASDIIGTLTQFMKDLEVSNLARAKKRTTKHNGGKK